MLRVNVIVQSRMWSYRNTERLSHSFRFRVRNWQKWDLNAGLWDSTVHDLPATPQKGLESHKEMGWGRPARPTLKFCLGR